jgi:hypothetical protein
MASSVTLVIMEIVCIPASLPESLGTGGKRGGNEGVEGFQVCAGFPDFRKVRKPGTLARLELSTLDEPPMGGGGDGLSPTAGAETRVSGALHEFSISSMSRPRPTASTGTDGRCSLVRINGVEVIHPFRR